MSRYWAKGQDTQSLVDLISHGFARHFLTLTSKSKTVADASLGHRARGRLKNCVALAKSTEGWGYPPTTSQSKTADKSVRPTLR